MTKPRIPVCVSGKCKVNHVDKQRVWKECEEETSFFSEILREDWQCICWLLCHSLLLMLLLLFPVYPCLSWWFWGTRCYILCRMQICLSFNRHLQEWVHWILFLELFPGFPLIKHWSRRGFSLVSKWTLPSFNFTKDMKEVPKKELTRKMPTGRRNDSLLVSYFFFVPRNVLYWKI